LHSALARVKEARAKRDTLPRLVTFARLAWETGQRAEAVAALAAAGPRIEAEAETIRREPFLPPAPRYEQIRPGSSAKEWLLCAVAETYERLSAFSSLYAPESSLPMMEGISGSLLRSPETERRRQLARMRAGTQDRPQPHPLLSELTDENLNPQFWCGSAIAA
jgi:hypothetical protein